MHKMSVLVKHSSSISESNCADKREAVLLSKDSFVCCGQRRWKSSRSMTVGAKQKVPVSKNYKLYMFFVILPLDFSLFSRYAAALNIFFNAVSASPGY